MLVSALVYNLACWLTHSIAITTKAQPKPKPKPQRSLGNNFREIMGLTDDKETFETIKKHLRDVLERHLDWNLRWRDQPDNTWDILDAEVSLSFRYRPCVV